MTTLYKLDAGDDVEVGAGAVDGPLALDAVGDYAPLLAMSWVAAG